MDQRVFKQLLLGQFPEMCAHLEGLGVDVSCVFAQWFLSCFVNALPLESCLRAWDLLFLEGSTLALFRWAAGSGWLVPACMADARHFGTTFCYRAWPGMLAVLVYRMHDHACRLVC